MKYNNTIQYITTHNRYDFRLSSYCCFVLNILYYSIPSQQKCDTKKEAI